MCLITNQTDPIILTEPLTVYKWLDIITDNGAVLEIPISPFRGEPYEESKGKRSEFVKDLDHIEDGLHSYLDLIYAKAQADIFWYTNPIIVEMVIPAGSEVYYSENGKEITSNHLTWPEGAKVHKL